MSGTLFTNPDSNFFPNSRRTHTWSWQDNASWSHGNHTLTFGVQVQSYSIRAKNYLNALPQLNIGNDTSASALGSGQFTGGISDADLATANQLLEQSRGNHHLSSKHST